MKEKTWQSFNIFLTALTVIFPRSLPLTCYITAGSAEKLSMSDCVNVSNKFTKQGYLHVLRHMNKSQQLERCLITWTIANIFTKKVMKRWSRPVTSRVKSQNIMSTSSSNNKIFILNFHRTCCTLTSSESFTFIHPSFFISACPLKGRGGARAYPSWHWARSRVQAGQVANLSQGWHTETD